MTAVFSRLALDYLGFGSLYVNNSTSTHFPLLLQNVVVLFQRRFCVNAFSHVLPPSPLFTFRELQIQACVASFVVGFVFQCQENSSCFLGGKRAAKKEVHSVFYKSKAFRQHRSHQNQPERFVSSRRECAPPSAEIKLEVGAPFVTFSIVHSFDR